MCMWMSWNVDGRAPYLSALKASCSICKFETRSSGGFGGSCPQVRMSRDVDGEAHYLSALRAFRSRTTYSNSGGDHLVRLLFDGLSPYCAATGSATKESFSRIGDTGRAAVTVMPGSLSGAFADGVGERQAAAPSAAACIAKYGLQFRSLHRSDPDCTVLQVGWANASLRHLQQLPAIPEMPATGVFREDPPTAGMAANVRRALDQAAVDRLRKGPSLVQSSVLSP